jgi:hypothetical protein
MSKIRKQREEDELAHEEKIVGKLRNHPSQKKKKIEALNYKNVTFDDIQAHHKYWVNSPRTWVNRQKTKNLTKLRVDLIRHVFGVYKCPRFLENVWLLEKNGAESELKFVDWYLAVAQGKSLFKECTKGILSKKETHAFLIAPNEFAVEQNIWWARGYCESKNNIGTAGKIAHSNLVMKDYKNEFWISVMRFFVRFPTRVSEMNNLMDFFTYTIRENENYSLKGRSLDTVRKSCEVWHRFLNKQRSIGGGNWDGCPITDSSYSVGKNEQKICWTMTQIKTGNDLLKEGQAMRHCVVSYKRSCMDGGTYIWSLSSKNYNGTMKRHLTIQLNQNFDVVQYQGVGNRDARPNEKTILQRWANDNGIQIKRHTWW